MNLALEGVEIAMPDGRSLIASANLTFEQGVTTLVGENGSGKSTLLRALFGLHPLKAGAIRFGPYDHRRDRKAFLAHAVFVPQNFTAYPELSGREFLGYFLRLRGQSKRIANERSREWLAVVGLESAAESRTGTYSAGMLHRLGFAYALQTGAPLCVMDEPFAGVDPRARAVLTDLLFDVSVDRVTIVCTHHVNEMAERGAATSHITGGRITLGAPQSR
ncbi:MAG: ATP-binding cassette domain-containing protein [Thermoanaerobaculales bacterium]